MAFTRSSFAIAAASLDALPTSAPFTAAVAAAKAKALKCRNGKPTSQSYTSKSSREKFDLCDYSFNPVRDKAWIADQITLLQDCKRLHNEVTAVTAPRFSWKDHFVKQDDLNLFAFQTLIGLILSPAVSDEAVIDAMKNLASKGLFSSIDALANASVSVVLSCLAHLNYNNKKAGYIIDAAKYIVTNCNSKVPRSFEKLQEIRGVGEKVAALTLLEGFDDDSHAIYGIDSHMYKLFRTYLNWVDIEDTTITMMAIRLKTWLPQHYWKQLNPIFSGLGQLFRLLKEDQLEKEMFVKAEYVGGTSFKETIVKVSLLYQNQPKREKELRKQELKQNPPTGKDLLSLSNGKLISDLLLLGWEQSYKNKNSWRIYRPGFNDKNPGVYNSDWFDDADLVRDSISNNTGRSRASRRDIVHYYPTTTNKPKTIIKSNKKLDEKYYENAQLFAEENFDEDFDLSLINVDHGDSFGWYLYNMKGGRKLRFPVICFGNEDGTNNNNNNSSLQIQYFGKHVRFALTPDTINESKFISFEQCNNHVNEEYLQTYMKYLKTLSPFKTDPLLRNIEECYIRKIWKELYPESNYDKETDNDTDDDDNEKEMISEYELSRIRNIKRNEKRLRQLGLIQPVVVDNDVDDDDNDSIDTTMMTTIVDDDNTIDTTTTTIVDDEDTGSSRDDVDSIDTTTTKKKKKITTRRSRKRIVASILIGRTRRTKRITELLGSIIDSLSGLRYSARIFLLQINPS